jgi:predicted RNA binding protein YcfA (HicA-like mRNA interferase family)
MHKLVKELVKAARQQGWRVEIRGGGHVSYYSPEGTVVFGPLTPSDYRALRNCKAELRRAGLQLAEKGTAKKRPRPPRPRPRLPQTDLKKIYDRAADCGLSRSEVNFLVRTQFKIQKPSHLPRHAIKNLLAAIVAEGKKRQAEAPPTPEPVAVVPEAPQDEQERERVRAIRQAKKNNSNRARLAARRAKRRQRGKR